MFKRFESFKESSLNHKLFEELKISTHRHKFFTLVRYDGELCIIVPYFNLGGYLIERCWEAHVWRERRSLSFITCAKRVLLKDLKIWLYCLPTSTNMRKYRIFPDFPKYPFSVHICVTRVHPKLRRQFE